MDLKLDTSGDLDLSTGDAVLLDGIEEIRQRVEIKLKFFKGEWFLAPNFGVPWFRDILIKNPQTDVVRNLLIRAVETEPNIDKVTEITLTYDATTRALIVDTLQILANGERVDFETFQPIEL